MGAAAPPAAIGSSATGVRKRSKKANVNSPAAHRYQRPKNEVQKSNCARNVPTNKKTTCWNTSFFYWRRHPDLNRGSRICSPMPYHLAMAPSSEQTRSIPLPGQAGKRNGTSPFFLIAANPQAGLRRERKVIPCRKRQGIDRHCHSSLSNRTRFAGLRFEDAGHVTQLPSDFPQTQA